MASVPADAALNPYLESALSRLAGEGPVLDLGCGRGFWLQRMAAGGCRPVGIEPEPDRARLALAHAPVAAADGARLPLRDGSVGLAWCLHVLHHLDDPERALAEIRRVLRPGGHLLLAETVEDHPAIRLVRRVRPSWDGIPVRSRFGAGNLLDLVRGAGFEVVDSRQHSLLSFAAWTIPVRPDRAWVRLSQLEARLPAWFSRWGAHVECVARAA